MWEIPLTTDNPEETCFRQYDTRRYWWEGTRGEGVTG